jgi:hypothetical protein
MVDLALRIETMMEDRSNAAVWLGAVAATGPRKRVYLQGQENSRGGKGLFGFTYNGTAIPGAVTNGI